MISVSAESAAIRATMRTCYAHANEEGRFVVSKHDYVDWLGSLSDDERKRVEEIVLDLRSTCEDPEALVLADAHSEYALVARHLLGLDEHDKSSRSTARWAMDGLERNNGSADARRHKASKALERIRAAGISEDEILDFAEHIHSFTMSVMRQRIDDMSTSPQFLTDPGWAVMELRGQKMSGRPIAGGKAYHPGEYELDPWPDGVPRPRYLPFWRSEGEHPSSET